MSLHHPNRIDEIIATVVGVSHDNQDGSSRQEVIEYCDDGDKVYFRREPDHPYDLNAIAVWCCNKQAGYLDSVLAIDLAEYMDSGRKLSGEVYRIKGGSEKYPTFGMDIIIYMQTDLADDRIPRHIQYQVPSKKEVALEPFKLLLYSVSGSSVSAACRYTTGDCFFSSSWSFGLSLARLRMVRVNLA